MTLTCDIRDCEMPVQKFYWMESTYAHIYKKFYQSNHGWATDAFVGLCARHQDQWAHVFRANEVSMEEFVIWSVLET